MAYTWNELEKISNKVTSFSETPSDVKYPSEKLVKDTIDKLEADIAEGNIVVAKATTASNATVAQYASEDTSKGTIEERLTNLGYKEGVVRYERDGEYTDESDTLRKQGKYVLFDYLVGYASQEKPVKLTIPEGFRPKEDFITYFTCMLNMGTLGVIPGWSEITIPSETGEIIIAADAFNIRIQTGWETK